MPEIMVASKFVLLFFFFLVCSFPISCYGVTFSSLPRILIFSASPTQGQVLKAGEDQINVSWSYNTTFEKGTGSSLYKTINIKLCYAPISQKDRAWRKTVDILAKDKTCQFNIVVDKPFSPSNNTFTWTIKREIPTATYFVRGYVYNSANEQVGFGQTTDAHKTTNLFQIQGISGRNASINIAAICFSVFSVLSLAGFFFLERKKGKAS